MTFWPALGSYKYPKRPKKALLGAPEVLGGPWRSSEGPRALIWSQLPLAGPTGWVTPISCALAPYGTATVLLGPPKGLVLGPNGSFGGPRGPRRAQGGQIWSQLPPIGPPVLDSCSPHTFTWYRALSGPLGVPKGPVLGRNAPFGGPGGPRRAPGGQI